MKISTNGRLDIYKYIKPCLIIIKKTFLANNEAFAGYPTSLGARLRTILGGLASLSLTQTPPMRKIQTKKEKPTEKTSLRERVDRSDGGELDIDRD